MFKLYIKFFSLLCLLPFVGTEDTYGQIRASFGNKTIVENKTIVRNKEKASAKVKARSSKTEEDTVYAISLKKQHGWTMPLQVVDKKDIHRYNKIYRFSRKNASGNWCRVECIDGHGNYVPESFQTYIVKANSESESDVKASYTWREKIQAVCRIDLISNPTGEIIIQERAYDRSGAMVFSFSISPINSAGKVYVGNYRDSNGLPSEIRPDDAFSYGTLVFIERDKWGNDSIIRYIDSKGYAKPNSDGVYSEQLIHDEFGRLIKRQSMDSNGRPVYNEAGNCGEEYEYDDRNNKIRTTALNLDWFSSELKSELEEVSQLFQYDELSRLIEMKYVNQYDKPIENKLGIHKVIYQYNDYGDQCLICGFDKDGNPSSYDEEGVCKTIYVYDERGNNLEYHYFDDLGNPKERKSYPRFSSSVADFDFENKLIKRVNYKVQDGSEIPYVTFEKNDTVEITLYSDKSGTRDSFSLDGQKIRRINYGRDSKINSMKEFFYKVPHEKIPFTNPNFSELIDIEIEKYTSEGNPTSIYYRDHEVPYRIYTRCYGDSISDISGAYEYGIERRYHNLNKWGHISHGNEYASSQVYNRWQSDNIAGIMNCRYGTDEFGDPSYIVNDFGEIFCYQLKSNIDDDIYLDDQNIPIQDFKAFKDDCPKYLCVGVVDSKGFEYGFSENDIILSINDRYIYPYESDSEFSIKKSLMSVLLSNEDKIIKVFRIDPVSLAISIKDISVGKGNLEDYGVKLHCYYATPRQHERISTLASGISVSEAKESYKDNKNPIVVLSNSSWKKDRELPYVVQNGRDAVLLAAQVMDFPIIKWSYRDGFDEIQNIIQSRGEVSAYTDSVPVLRLYVTNDGKTVKTVDAKRLDLGCLLLLGYVDSDTQKRLNSIANSIAFKNNEDILSLKNNFKDQGEAFKDSLYNRALVYDAFGRYDVSFDVLKRLALAGYSKALSNITDYYANGKGTKKNLLKAETYAIDANDGGASLCLIANAIAEKGNNAKASALLERVSSEDEYYDTALMRLGDLYLGKDSVMAKDYYFKALKNSNTIPKTGETDDLIKKIQGIDSTVSTMDSIYTIGLTLYDDKKYKEAFPIFKTLVDCNYRRAIYALTWCLMYGEGTDRNEDLAMSLAENEYIKKDNSAGIMMAAEYYVKNENYHKAIELYTKACNKGQYKFQAWYYLGEIFANPQYYGNNTYKAIKYWVFALMTYSFRNLQHQKQLDIIENYMDANASQYKEAVTGLFYLGWIYMKYNINDKGLDLIRRVSDVEPNFSSRDRDYNRLYYYAMQANNIPSMEEYESFMSDKIAVLTVPDDVNENDALFAYKGKKYKIISLNDWNNSPDRIKINLLDENRNDNVLVIEVDSKPVEIRTSKLNPSNITFEEI